MAVRLNLLGQPGEQPDFVVAAWVLPYVYALRGDRDWRRSPQLTGSRQVSPLAVQAYKHLEAGDATIPQLRHSLGREVSESAVLRAITELWQQLRIIPVISAPNKTPQWQLLRTRYQKAIAEGASTSQVTAISVLASIYLQAVIAASMEEVEMFLAPLTARSKVREVLRGLVATRQVHSLALGHAPHFYVAGTLPEFAAAPTIYASSSMPASSHFLRSYEHEEAVRMPIAPRPAPQFASAPVPPPKPAEPVIERPSQPPGSDTSFTAALQPSAHAWPATASRRRSPLPAASLAVPAATRVALHRAPLATRAMRKFRAGQRALRQTATVTASGTRPATPKALPTGTASIRTATPARAKSPTACIRQRPPRRERCATATRPTEKLLRSLFGAPMPPAKARDPDARSSPQTGADGLRKGRQPLALWLYRFLQSAIEETRMNESR